MVAYYPRLVAMGVWVAVSGRSWAVYTLLHGGVGVSMVVDADGAPAVKSEFKFKFQFSSA